MSRGILTKDFVTAFAIFFLSPFFVQFLKTFFSEEKVQIFLPFFILIPLFLFIYVNKERLGWLFQGNFLEQLKVSLLALCFSFPLVYGVSEILSLSLEYLFNVPHIDQLAVSLIRQIKDHPFLFYATLVNVIIFSPLLEEVLFRGFLQTYLKHYIGFSFSLILTSLIFALFHYSPDQGIYNFSILSSLFLLSCILGTLFEKRKSLISPIILHMLFNFISVCMIILT